MRFGAVAERVASLSAECHTLSSAAGAWAQRHLASASSSARLNEDQWLTVLYVTSAGLVVVTLCVIVAVRLTSRLKNAEEEIEKLSSSASCEPSPRHDHAAPAHHPLRKQHSVVHHGLFAEHHHQHQHQQHQHLQRSHSRLEDHRHAHRRPSGESPRSSESGTDGSAGGPGMIEMTGDELVDSFGISGLCLVSRTRDIFMVVVIACQAFFLQFIILFYIATMLTPRPDGLRRPKTVIVDAAIYLHFLNCVRDMPRAIFAFRAFRSTFVDDKPWHTLAFGIIYCVDAFVTPIAQLIIGALFLCTSATVGDVIMNSCAVAYISTIDNMILEVRKQMDELADRSEDHPVVKFPVNTDIIDVVQMTFVVVPVYPMAFSCCMAYLGLRVFHL
jgi:hypothetical protein